LFISVFWVSALFIPLEGRFPALEAFSLGGGVSEKLIGD
jgi:hypothetical protein